MSKIYEKYGFVVNDEGMIEMPIYSYDIEPFVLDVEAYSDLPPAQVAKLYLDLAQEYEDYYHEIVYGLKHIVDYFDNIK